MIVDETAPARQQGAVLFFALIALVVMTLAAIALVRSVDTANLISGNLAFKQSATTSGDTGVETAIDWIRLNVAALNTSRANANNGYYNSLNRTRDVTNPANLSWDDTNSSAEIVDAAGNRIRYIIQRMCTHPAGQPNSLLSGAVIDASNVNCVMVESTGQDEQKIIFPPKPTMLGSPVYRVTVRIAGPRNTVSFIQGFVH
jgi:Tfp pilus assembly protein PilX